MPTHYNELYDQWSFFFCTKNDQRFYQGLPDLKTTILLSIVFGLWALFCSEFSAFLKKKKKVKTGYSRKTFHFLIFISVAVIHYYWGYSGVCLFGIMVSGFVFYALLKREKTGLYQALARENDKPNSALYILLPYVSTLCGGLVLNYLYSDYASLGYLICGLGDASGEVIGSRFGNHRFTVKTLNIHRSQKSVEGSLSVLIITFIIYLSFYLSHFSTITNNTLLTLFILSVSIMLLEIYTIKGFDNLTIQIVSVVLYQAFV